MQRLKTVIAAVALAAVVAACGGSSHRTDKTIHPAGADPTSTVDTNAYKLSKLTRQQAGEAFRNLAYSANAAVDAVGAELQKLSAGTGGAVIGRLAEPAVKAIDRFNTGLQQLAAKYPDAADNLDNLRQADQPLILDMQNLKHVNDSNYKAWERQFIKDVAKVKAADRAVREQLGVPKSS